MVVDQRSGQPLPWPQRVRNTLPARLRREALLFLLAGASNSLLTFLLYQLLLLAVSYTLAFTAAFAAGIVYSATVYSTYVFGVRMRWTSLGVYGAYYCLSYGLSLALLHLVVRLFSVPDRLAIVLVMGLMVPVNFLSARLILRRPGAERAP